MSDFWRYFNIGLDYALGIRACMCILFLVGLIVSYTFKDWKKVLLIIGFFILGFLFSLLFTVLEWIFIKKNVIKWLVLVAILIITTYNLLMLEKSSRKEKFSLIGFITLCFGIIQGLSYYNSVVFEKVSNKTIALLGFASGVEVIQIIIIFIILFTSFIIQTIFRISKRDWILVVSSFAIGVVLPKLIESEIW